MITRDFDLWITQGHTKRLVFNANQYDQGETWRFRILGADGNPIVPTTAAIIGQKKDGHAILVNGTIGEDGRVTIVETEQMTACAGLTEFELLLNGETHGTANFTVQVEKRPGDDADLSDSDLSLIQDAVDAAEVIVEVIGDGDPSEVIGEHVDAWLDNHPEATTTVEDGAITAPKINNSLWDKLLVSEEASGAVASFDDGADDVPVSSLKVNLEPIQTGSGDPSPTNIRPIYPANGKNLLNYATATQSKNAIDFTNVQFVNGEIYTMTDYHASATMIAYKHGTSTRLFTSGYVSSYTYTAAETELVDIRFYDGNGLAKDPTYFQLERGSSATSYQPYQGIMVERCGKNLYPVIQVSTTTNGVTFTTQDDGSIKVDGTSSTYAFVQTLEELKAGSYIVSGGSESVGVGVRRTSDDYSFGISFGTDVSFTLTEDTCCKFRVLVNANRQTDTVVYPMLRLASITDATYEPYQSASYPYSLGQSVYGGTVDLATGVLTVNRILVDLDTLTTGWQTATVNGKAVLRRLVSAIKQEENKFYIKCSHLKYVGNTTGAVDNGTVTNLTTNYYNLTLCAPDLFTTQAELNAWTAEQKANGTPVQLSYLVDPTTVQLTPTEVKTLLGYNNISSTGTVDVIYHADTKLYVDKMTAVDNAIIAPTEADFVATRNYTVNDLVIVNDTLYKVTANIANGGTITPNSNVQQTTLSALIKALS